MSPLDYRVPEKWQLEFIDDLLLVVPIGEVEWLLANGNLEYYTQNYRRAQDLITRLDHSYQTS